MSTIPKDELDADLAKLRAAAKERGFDAIHSPASSTCSREGRQTPVPKPSVEPMIGLPADSMSPIYIATISAISHGESPTEAPRELIA